MLFGMRGKLMVLAAEERDALLSALESNGWFREGDFIYAPHRSIWLLTADPWQGDLSDFHERMSARLGRLAQQGSHYDDPLRHQHVVGDTQGLVATLKELLDAQTAS
jgi:hypothetical protein